MHNEVDRLTRWTLPALQPRDLRGTITFADAACEDTTRRIDRTTLLARFRAREDDKLLTDAAVLTAMWRAIPLRRSFVLARMLWVRTALDWSYVCLLRILLTLQRVLRGRQAS